ncbi:MAG: hypothetical protein L6R38_005806 [Xanthoria sp. 2 TBL-2021]|nr:MAG: hypothetical protein L6R38_005806 [Xanthoria sp. 2 TBL-2021]
MFHRRRASSNPPAKAPPTAAASTAAVQAFLASRASNANLSSAAAAAALRSRPTTPTAVGDLPTKRRAQRSGSVSSNGSSRPNLQRQNSAGSMTERTFRDPSPSRVNSERYYQDEAPPVPALPKGYVSPPPVPAKSLQRPASVEPPERVTSPVPRAGARGVSLDRAPGMVQAKQPKKQKRPNLGTVGEVERTQSRESINFSRPMSPQNSPPTSPLRELKAFPGISQPQAQTPTANMGVLRDGEADNIQYAIQDSATKPVKKKKKAAAKEMVEGSHFAGRSEAKPTGAAPETPKKAPVSTSSTPSPSHTMLATKKPTGAPQPGPKKKKKRVVSSESSQGSYASDSDSAMSDRSSSTDRPRSFNTRAAGLLAKQPSIVREDREAEEQEDYDKPVKQEYFKTSGPSGDPLTPASGASATAKTHKKSASQPLSVSTAFDNGKQVDMPGAPGDTYTTSTANGLSAKQPRPQSLSPGRAAHFLPQPTYETPDGIKHQPPARSVSPAKSALKHSPSSRGASPVGFTGSGYSRLPGAAGSEASDNGSVVSDDGSRLQPTRKKSARVSFDEDPVTVGHASIPPAADSPTLLSPQHKDSAKKGFLGFGRRREAGASAKDLDQDDGIKPTPTLPSFGSVRDRDRNEAESVPREGNEQGITQRLLPETQTSSDQIVGHVLSQDFASRKSAPVETVPSQQASNDPLPPEVTSVEGSGYHSEDDESTPSERGDTRDTEESMSVLPAVQQPTLDAGTAVQKSSVPETESRGDDQQALTQNGFVPSIAILPATPGIGSNENEEEGWFNMPGGFSASDPDQRQQSISSSEPTEVPISSAATAVHYATDPTPARLGIAEPEPESTTTSIAGSPIVGHVAEGIHHQTEVSNDEESDDTGNSIYSDAAEDISDLEGDGFGSINAIMESPVAPRTPFLASLRPESPVAQTPSPSSKTVRPKNVSRKESELSEPASEEGWDQAQAYWSGLSQSRKEQLERAAQRDDTKDSSVENEVAPVPKPAPAARPNTDERPKKKKMVKKTNQSTDPPLPPWPDREFRKEATRPVSPTGGGMKQSMRPSHPEGSQAQMRSSMRNGVPLKSSIRNSVNLPETQPAARGGSTKKGRPVSAVAMGDYEKGSEKTAISHGRAASVGVTPKTAMAASPQPKKIAKPALRRAASDDSDSSSSFKKSRPSTSDGGKYSMKRTMRGASIDGRPQSAYASKPPPQSARSSSPTSRRPFSTAGSGMRTSMRDSMDSGLGSRTKSPSRSFGFGRKSEPKAVPKKTGSRFTSRFGDSSDEEEAPIKRRSRIVDSSGEEDNVGLTPVRGIPRRIDEGDSTDLEDSSASPSPAIQTRDNQSKVPATKPAEGSALATGSLRAGQADKPAEKEKKKRSFFGGLGGSKKQSQPPPINTTLPPASTSRPPAANYSSPQPPSSPKTPKAARLLGTDVATSPNPSQASPKSPKLQRRNTPKRFASDSWPLPENNTMPPAATIANNEKLRPSTSDGAGVGKPLAMGTMRPEAGNRRFTAEGQPLGTNGAVGAVAGGKEAKKRRFPMLRKALGLKDSGR